MVRLLLVQCHLQVEHFLSKKLDFLINVREFTIMKHKIFIVKIHLFHSTTAYRNIILFFAYLNEIMQTVIFPFCADIK